MSKFSWGSVFLDTDRQVATVVMETAQLLVSQYSVYSSQLIIE